MKNMQRSWIVVSVGLLIILSAIGPLSADTWTKIIVDGSCVVGDGISTALDGSGAPHFAYADATNDVLKYASWTGSGWNIEVVDNSASVGQYASLVLDDSGYGHISYYDSDNGALKYASFNGTSWDIETVDGGGDVGSHTSLGLAGDGTPHISYLDDTNTSVKYASKGVAGWGYESVDDDASDYTPTSLAVDGGGTPHLVFQNADGYIEHAYKSGGSWSFETVTNTQWADDAAIALDGSDNPSVSYMDPSGTADRLGYAAYDGGWISQIADDSDNVGYVSSLDFDPDGNPHIGYGDGANMGLKYAWHDGSGWKTMLLDTATGNMDGGALSLAVDDDSYTHIGGAYFGPASEGLMYITNDPSAVPEPGTIALLGIGLAALGVVRRRRT